MIMRIFNVSIKEHLIEDFEKEFELIAEYMQQNCEGLVSCQIGYPTKITPYDYSLLTQWKDEDALISFVGENWHEAYIPEHMQKYPTAYSAQHYVIK